MKGFKPTIAGVILVGLGVAMAITNPGKKTYEEYAAEKMRLHLQENVCPELTEGMGNFSTSICQSVVDTASPQLKSLISQKTKQQNFILFSIYRTDLFFPSPIPDYHFETLGAFQQFLTYQAEKQ